jgi:hybrid cluster-associated redox disulfide protein
MESLFWRNEGFFGPGYLNALFGAEASMGDGQSKPLDRSDTVDSVMRRWPATIRVFIEHRMLCIGCPIGTLHTIEDACRAHDLDPDGFQEALSRAVRRPPRHSHPEADPSASNRSL